MCRCAETHAAEREATIYMAHRHQHERTRGGHIDRIPSDTHTHTHTHTLAKIRVKK